VCPVKGSSAQDRKNFSRDQPFGPEWRKQGSSSPRSGPESGWNRCEILDVEKGIPYPSGCFIQFQCTGMISNSERNCSGKADHAPSMTNADYSLD